MRRKQISEYLPYHGKPKKDPNRFTRPEGVEVHHFPLVHYHTDGSRLN
jgi:hypothetical protein